jgi:hypothetical protein
MIQGKVWSTSAAAMGAAATLALGLGGCMTPRARLGSPVSKRGCVYAACGSDAESLAKVTAANLQTALETVAIDAIQPQFSGAVLVWRATVKGRAYLCREGRDPGDVGGVHYVDSRRTQATSPEPASLKAFPPG